MKMKKLVGLFFFMLIFSTITFAQEYKAEATLDSNRILIGDQIHVDFSLTAPKNVNLAMPELTNENMANTGIELVAKTAIDTTVLGEKMRYHQRWTITAFDSGSYIFPPIGILGPDSQLLAQSQALPFEVNTVAVDTTAAIRDIKSYAKVPLTFKEVLPYLLIGIAVVAVIALIVWLIVKYQSKRKPKKIVSKPKPKVKPHITALKELENLKLKKLWQNGQIKQYYSELTDILRIYIDGRFGINAMEMISSDIIRELNDNNLDNKLMKELEQTLTTADLVKFAKMEPFPDDHDRCFQQAIDFVKSTAETTETQNSVQH